MNLDRVSAMALTAAACAVAVAVVHREFRGTRTPIAGDRKPAYYSEWKKWEPLGHRVTDSRGPVTIIEFADFQCPFCRALSKTIRNVQAQRPGTITHVFVHFPIHAHPHAYMAARSAECAAAQGRFTPMHDLLFAKQDSIGRKTWASFGVESGVPDLKQYSKCTADTSALPAIDEGRLLGAKLEVSGTPAMLINGWLYSGNRPDTNLLKIIDAIRTGKKPHP